MENTTSITEEEQLLQEIKAEAESMQSASTEIETEAKPEVKSESKSETQEEVVESNLEEQEPKVQESETAKDNDNDISKMSFEKPITLKDRSLELPVNNMQELIALAQQGLNWTRKRQVLAEHKAKIDTLNNAGIEDIDLQMLVDLKAGNKEAINGLAKKYNIDLFEHDNTIEYTPKAVMPVVSEVDMVASEIMENPELSTKLQQTVQYVPDSFKAKLATDANMLRGFAIDVQNGIAEKLMPEANKIFAMNPNIDFIQAYVEAGNRIFGSQQEVAPVAQEVSPKPAAKIVANADSSLKAKASITTGSSSNAKSDDLDIWADGLSDSELAARIQAKADELRRSKQSKF